MADGDDPSTVLALETNSSDESDRLIRAEEIDPRDAQTFRSQRHPFSPLLNYLFNSHHHRRGAASTASSATLSDKLLHRRKRSPQNTAAAKLKKPTTQSYIQSFLLLVISISFLTFSASVLYRTWSTRVRGRSYTPWLTESQHHQHHEKYQRDRWVVSTPKCHIPKQDPWDKSIEGYVKRWSELDCTEVGEEKENIFKRSLSYVADNKLFFTEEALMKNALKDCCYQNVSRVTPEDAETEIFEELRCVQVNENGFESPFSVIKLHCKALNYTNYHSFVIPDKEEEESCQRNADRFLNTSQYYNILLVGVDTVSRLDAIRQFNESLKVLHDQYDTVVFNGYNKVGENTFPNLVPFLAGLSEEQLVETGCWKPAQGFDPRDEAGSDHFDRCKFLWNYYQDIGYRTFYTEDWPSASTFNYLKWGFKLQPTSYYGRPYVIARDEITKPQKAQCHICAYDKPLVELDLNNLETFILQHQKKPFFALNWINCPQHDGLNFGSQIDPFLARFFKRVHPSIRDTTFVIFFSDHGQRYGSFTRNTRIGYYESSLPLLSIAAPRNFIRKHPKLYKNLISHTSSLLTPYDMFKTLLAINDLVKRKNPARFKITTSSSHSVKKANASAITTEAPKRVFGDLTPNVTGPTAVTIIRQEKMYHGDNFPHSIKILSLLDAHSRRDLDRSCTEVGIPDNYCRCHSFKPANTEDIDVLGASYYLVYHHIHEDLARKDKDHLCALLDFDVTQEAEKYDLRKLRHMPTEQPLRRKRVMGSTGENLYEDSAYYENEAYAYEHVLDLPIFEYKLQVFTKPGRALFGEVVRYRGDVNMTSCKDAIQVARLVIEDSDSNHDKKVEAVEKMNKVCQFDVHDASIARLNAYRGQTDCLKHNAKLAKICYCKDTKPTAKE